MGSEGFTYTVEVDNDINFGSIDATVSSISSASASQAITGLAAGTTYYFRVRAVNATGAGANSSTSAGIQTTAAASPTITLSASTLSGVLSATYPAASIARSFTVSGAALTGNLTVQPSPANSNFEFSTSENGTYSSSLTLTASGGTVSSTTVWVRLKTKAAAGTYNNAVIRVSGGGATQQDIAATSSGNTVTAKALTISGATATARAFNGTTTVAVSGGTLVGVESGDSVTLGGSPTGTMADANAGNNKAVTVTGYTIDNTNYSLTQPTGVTVNISKVTPTIATAPTASSVFRGARLDSSTITGGSVTGVGGATLTGGTFAWTDAGSTIVTATGSRSVTYTPQDTTNYNNATANATLTVNAVPNPSSTSATSSGQTSINLSHTRNSGISVMIVRKAGSAVDFTPTDTTTYADGQDVGGGNIVVKGTLGADSFSDTSLSPATTYHYKVFSEHYGYYSTGLTASVATDTPPANYGLRDDSGVNLPTLTYSVNGTATTEKGSVFSGKNLSNSVTSLSLTGANIQIWKQSGGDVTGTKLEYKVWKTTDTEPATYTERSVGYFSGAFDGTTTTQVWSSFGSAINLLSGLGSNYGTYNIKVRFTVQGTGWPGTVTDGPFTATFTYPEPATISTTGTLAALTSTYGTASSSTSFNVSGANMTAGITVTPPAGFEVSTSSTFASNVGTSSSPITVGAAGTINATTVYVRLAANTGAGSKSGNIVLTSSGAANVNVATASSTVNKKDLDITVASQTIKYGFPKTGATSVVAGAAVNGYTVDNTDLVSPDTAATAIGGTAAYDTTYVQGDTAGTTGRKISLSGLTSSNYNLVIAEGDVTISALTNPASPTATTTGTTSIRIDTTNDDFVLIVRSASDSFTAPTQGTVHEKDATFGAGTVVYRGAAGAFSDTGLSAGTTYYYKVYTEYYGYYSSNPNTISATTSSDPAILIAGGDSATATAFTTTYGTASAAQTFAITGSALTANITATAPTGFEVSSNGSTWGSTATFTQSSGSASGTLHVRLAATATVAGTYNSQTIQLTSTGATARNVTTASSGNSVGRKTLDINVGNRTITYGLPATGGTSVVSGGNFTVDATDLVNSDATNVVTGTATYTTTYVAGDTAGTAGRTITLSGLTADNYTLNVVPGSVTIETLNNPNPVSATSSTTNSVSLTHTRTNNIHVLIVRRANSAVTFTPTPGAQYTDGQVVDGHTIVRGSLGADTFSDEGLASNTTYYYKVYSEYYRYYSAGDTTSATTLGPTITIAGGSSATATAFSTTYGTASSSQTFAIGGSYLTGNITATAVSGFEVSSNGSTWGSTATFTQIAGSVSGTLHVRLTSTAAANGTYNSQNITLASSGATTRNLATASTGNVVNKKSLDITVGNRTVLYGLPAGDATATGGGYTVDTSDLVNGDTSAVVTGTATYTTTYEQGDAAGTSGRTFSVTGLSATNYELNIIPGTVTVSALNAPTFVSANSSAVDSVNLSFTRPAGTSVLIVRRDGSAVSWNPEQGIGYSTGYVDVDDDHYVLEGALDDNSYPDSSVTHATTYHYAVYTEHHGYYSIGVAVNATTLGPTISVTGTLSALSTTYGSASSTTSFSVSGANLLSGYGLTVTPPAGFEVSTNSTTGFNSEGINLDPTNEAGDAVASTDIYVRLAATNGVGDYSGNIFMDTLDASENVATVSSSVLAKEVTITGLSGVNKTYDGGTSASFTGNAAYDGLVDGETFTVLGTPSASFANKNVGTNKIVTIAGYTAPTANYTLTSDPTVTANITAKTLTITAAAKSKTYGAADPALTYTDSGLVAGDSISGSLTRVAGENAGTYAIQQGTVTAGSNYSISYTGANLTINAASLPAITWSNGVITSSGGVSGFSYVHTGVSSNGITTTYSNTVAPTLAGYYQVVATSTDDNYSGTATNNYFVTGPIAGDDERIIPTGNSTFRIPQESLLTNDRRIDSSGTVSSSSLSITGATGQGGNTASLYGVMIDFTPAGAGNQNFTYTLTDGVTGKTAAGNVLLRNQTSVSPFNITGTVGTAEYDGDGTAIRITFTGSPKETYHIYYKGSLTNAVYKYAGGFYSTNTVYTVDIYEEGNHVSDWTDNMFFQGVK